MCKEDIDKALAAQRQARGYQPPKRGEGVVETPKPTIWWAWYRLRSEDGEPLRLTSSATPRRPTEQEALDHLGEDTF